MSSLKLAVNSNDHHSGNVNAAITLVEYGDFQCPHCKHAHTLVKRLLKEKGDEFHFVFRNFPLREIHRFAHNAAIAAEAAGKQGKFWEMHDVIFDNQNRLTANYLMSLAESIGLDQVQFARDSNSEEVAKKVERDFESGIRSGVNGTPTFFLNSSILLTYDQTYDSLLDALFLESKT